LATRRLIALMIVLLFLSSLAAALVPVREETGRDETRTQVTKPQGKQGSEEPRGELVRATVAAGGKPETVDVAVGDQLQLRVTAKQADTFELVGLSGAEDAAPAAPAYFDVLIPETGTFRLRSLISGKPVAFVEARKSAERPKPRSQNAPQSDPASGDGQSA
jgi:hypothetical protein